MKSNYKQLRVALTTLASTIAYDEIGEKIGEELYAFLLKDSKVPDMVIDGVEKFINFRKYLRMTAKKGPKKRANLKCHTEGIAHSQT